MTKTSLLSIGDRYFDHSQTKTNKLLGAVVKDASTAFGKKPTLLSSSLSASVYRCLACSAQLSVTSLVSAKYLNNGKLRTQLSPKTRSGSWQIQSNVQDASVASKRTKVVTI